MQNIYIYLGIYFLILLSISFFVSKKEKKEDFLISGRDRKWWTIMASKFAGAVGIGWFITYTGYAYKYGMGVYIVILGFLLGYALFAFWVVPKIFKIAKKNKFYTQGDLVFFNTNDKFSKTLTNYFSIIIQFNWLLVTIIGGAKIISSLGISSYETSLLFTIFTVLSYILLAGYKAVLITDIFQSIIIVVLLFLVSYNIVGIDNFGEILYIETGRLSIVSIIGFLLYGILSILALADRYQLTYAAKNEKDIKLGMFFTFIPISIVAIFVIFIGLFMNIKNPNLDADLVFLESLNYLPQNLFSLGIVLLFAGLMSSADTYIYTIASHIVLNKKQNKNSIKNIRVAIIILMIVIGIISYFFRDIIGVTIVSAGLSLVMSIPMIYIIKGGKNKNRFNFSVYGGIIGLILGIFFIGLEPSIALTVLIGGLLGLIKK